MENHHESPCFDQKLPAELINPSGVPGPAFDTLSIPIQSHTMVTNWYKGYGHPSSYSDYSGSINISLIYIYTYILYNIHIYNTSSAHATCNESNQLDKLKPSVRSRVPGQKCPVLQVKRSQAESDEANGNRHGDPKIILLTHTLW